MLLHPRHRFGSREIVVTRLFLRLRHSHEDTGTAFPNTERDGRKSTYRNMLHDRDAAVAHGRLVCAINSELKFDCNLVTSKEHSLHSLD